MAADDAIRYFAESCEKLIDYARHLRASGKYPFVVTEVDIRNYQSGWKLEKGIEASLNKADSFRAVWWLELSYADNAWLVVSYLAISPSEFELELPERSAASTEGLRQALAEAVAELVNAAESNQAFILAMEKYRQASP